MKRISYFTILCAWSALAAVGATADTPLGDPVPIRQVLPPEVKNMPKEEGPPSILRWMLAPLKRGMFVRLPIVDTDPNRGVTYGVMPIFVLQGAHDDRIEQIHAPSLTYNKNFGLLPTYRYYFYPQEDASFVARASRSNYEHEVMVQYEDHSFLGTDYTVFGRGLQGADAGQHFFGLGPDSAKSAETNYKENLWTYKLTVGAPLWFGSNVRFHLSQHYQTSRITDGPLLNLPNFHASFPAQFSDRAQQANETRLNLDYDTRDHSVTTTKGKYANVFFEESIRGFLSQYDYKRIGLDGRWFHPWESHPGWVFASQIYYEQVLGPTPPFWLLPSLGGKYSLRAYGDGRYVDRGVTSFNVEQRFKVYQARTAGVTTEIQLAPFIGVGEAFDTPNSAAAKYARPVFGAAVRAVARPQVVGSVDVGIGRDGVSVFTDINYSF